MVDLFNTGIIPGEYLKSTLIIQRKKSKDYNRKFVRRIEYDRSDTQFGFRNPLSIREALFAFNVLARKLIDSNLFAYATFSGYNKTFDRISHNHVVNLIKNKDINRNDTLVTHLFFSQITNVYIDNERSVETQVKNIV